MGIMNKLHMIQLELNAPKKQYNEYGKYYYRTCEDILEALKPLLDKHGCAVVLKDEAVQIGERYYIKATATIYDVEIEEGHPESSFSSFSNTAYAREADDKKGTDASQLTGATSSYARKYALNGLFLIDDVKDADSTNKHSKDEELEKKTEEKKPEEKKPERKMVTEAQVNSLIKKCEKEGVEIEKICRLYKVKSLTDLTEYKYNNIIKYWEKVKESE